MNSFEIKLIAMITMVIDHIGMFFFPHVIILRVIGRLSFILFAWLIANGAYHTKNIHLYTIRIFLLALISQYPYILANWQIDATYMNLNAIFTLFLGLVAINIIQITKNKIVWSISTIACIGIADWCKTDYGALGIFCILAFYLFYTNLKYMIISQIFIVCILPITIFLLESHTTFPLSKIYSDSLPESFSLFALIFIAKYNQKEGIKAQSLFYYFYPVQYIFILFLEVFS